MRSIYVDPLAVGEPRVTHIDYDTRSTRFDATHRDSRRSREAERTSLRGSRLPDRRSCDRSEGRRARQYHKRRGHRDGAASAQRGRPGRHHQTRRRYRHGSARSDAGWPPVASRGSDEADLVLRNETVTLVYEAPGMVLTIRGKANDGGAEGDVISVLNEQSKRVVQGMIVGPGRVASRRFAAPCRQQRHRIRQCECALTINLLVPSCVTYVRFHRVENPVHQCESNLMKVVMVMRHAVLAALPVPSSTDARISIGSDRSGATTVGRSGQSNHAPGI